MSGVSERTWKTWLTSPGHADPELQLRAHIIHWISLVGFITLTPLTALLPVLEENFQYALPIYIVALLGVATSFVTLHLGSIRAAALIMTVLAWFITLWVSFAAGGMSSPQLSMGVLAIMLAGILLSGWGALTMAIAIGISLLALEFLRQAGLMPQPFVEGTPFTVWAALFSVLIISAVLLNLYVNAMRSAREEATKAAERLAAEMERRLATEASLQRAEKLEALGRLSGGIAHDFNNILTVLEGESELLELSADDERFNNDELANISAIRRATEKASALTSQLLAFSRQQPRAQEQVEVDAALARLQTILRRLIRADVNLEVSAGAAGAQISIDPSQLDQILMNLTLNASDAMPDGGDLTIATSEKTHEAKDFVCIEVTDSGEGIAADNLELIFDPFFTTKSMGQGTGLGLSSTHGIVTGAGGHIDIQSQPGQGTQISVLLPRVTEPSHPSITDHARPDVVAALDILLCEDNEEVRTITQKMLVLAGHRVITLPDAEATVHWLENHSDNIDLLITDVILPGMNGAALAQHVRSLRPELRVLLISGYTSDVLAGRGVSEDVELLQKPFTSSDLIDRINAVVYPT